MRPAEATAPAVPNGRDRSRVVAPLALPPPLPISRGVWT
jgi:hypothetical protein